MACRECVEMVAAFERQRTPLWVAYYRRALPRFLKVRELVLNGAIGHVTSVQVEVLDELATAHRPAGWRVDPEIAGAGLFFDFASHCFDLLDFLIGPVTSVAGFALNTGGAYEAEDVTATAFELDGRVAGTGLWNFHAERQSDRLLITGSAGWIGTPIFANDDVLLTGAGRTEVYPIRNPPHVHQPLIQTIENELSGQGRCESRGESGARTSWCWISACGGTTDGELRSSLTLKCHHSPLSARRGPVGVRARTCQ